MTPTPGHDIFICLADLKRLFLRVKKQIFWIAGLCAAITFCYLAVKEPSYIASATFKHSIASKEDHLHGLKSLLQGSQYQSDNTSVISLMLSKKLVRDVVEHLGLQISVKRPLQTLSSIFANISLEMGRNISDIDPFVFKEVLFEQEKAKTLFLRFLSHHLFEILDEDKNLIIQGRVSEKVAIEDVEFILEKTPKDLKLKKYYALTVHPWPSIVENYLKKLEIKHSKIDSHILLLTIGDRNRHLAALFLNDLMASYQKFLKNEDDQLAKSQFAYLEKRQDELTQKLDHTLEEHVSYLKKNIGDNGFIGINEEVEIFAAPKEEYTSRLFDIELNLKRLEKVRDDRLVNLSKSAHRDLQTCSSRMNALDLQQKTIEDKELIEIQSQIEEANLLCERVKNGKDLPKDLHLLNDPKSLVRNWIEEFQKSKLALETADEEDLASLQGRSQEERKGFLDFMHATVQHLLQKENMIKENHKLKTSFQKDFQGISLSTAEKLTIDYNHQLDGIQATIRQLIYIRDQMQESDFELSSLAAVLNDPVTSEMVQKASVLCLQLRDENNRSPKEQERVKESLATQKKFIHHHIGQSIELHKLRAKLVEDKIASLQEVCIDLIKHEKALLEDKLLELGHKMSGLPEKWRLENQLKFKTKLSSSILEGMTQLVESKSVNHHLFQFNSKPLDSALPPVKAKKPRLFILSLVAAFLAGLGSYMVCLFRTLGKGLPVSMESLKVFGQHVCGKLSIFADAKIVELPDDDLETLRRLCTFITKTSSNGVTVALLGEKGPNYSHSLARLLSMQDLRVLLVDCIFNDKVMPDEIPGLLQYLNKEIAYFPIRKKEYYDQLPAGGTTRHGAEMLSTARFSAMASELKSQYDVVLLYCRAPLESVDASVLLKNADLTAVTVFQETFEDLKAYMPLNQVRAQECVTFLLYETT